jgi:phosphatidylethanolamine-binding protein (PEBP) family uncharacterized protein
MEVKTQSGKIIEPNTFVSPDQLSSEPSIKSPYEDYLLIFYDPDAVGPSTFLHWIYTMKKNERTDILSYYGPHPPVGSGTHNYVINIYPFQSINWTARKVSNISDVIQAKPLMSFTFQSAFRKGGAKRSKNRKRHLKPERKTKRRRRGYRHRK